MLTADIPQLKSYIEDDVDNDILANPYILYETEYDDFMAEKAYMQKKRPPRL